jgi:hypothetical protein
MRIDIEHVQELKEQLDEINKHSLHLIEIYENGVKIETDRHLIEALEQARIPNFNIMLDMLYRQ